MMIPVRHGERRFLRAVTASVRLRLVLDIAVNVEAAAMRALRFIRPTQFLGPLCDPFLKRVKVGIHFTLKFFTGHGYVPLSGQLNS